MSETGDMNATAGMNEIGETIAATNATGVITAATNETGASIAGRELFIARAMFATDGEPTAKLIA